VAIVSAQAVKKPKVAPKPAANTKPKQAGAKK